MEKNYVAIQGRFSSDGKFMDGKYVPGIVDELLDSVSGAFNDTTGLHRLASRSRLKIWARMSSSGSLQAKRSTPLPRSV